MEASEAPMIALLFLSHAKAGSDGVLCDMWRSMSSYGDFLSKRKEVAMALLAVGLLVNFLGIRGKRVSLCAIAFPVLRLSIGGIREAADSTITGRYGSIEDAPKFARHISALLQKMDNNTFFMAFLSVALGLATFVFVETIIYVLMGYFAFHLWGILESSASETMEGSPYYVYQAIMLCIGMLTLVLVKPITFLIYVLVFSAFGSLFIIVGANFGFGLGLELEECVNTLQESDFYLGLMESRAAIGYISLMTMGIVSQLLLRKKRVR